MRHQPLTTRDYHVALAYLSAKTTVLQRGFWPEVRSLAEVTIGEVTETQFLREAAWVVLSAGLSEVVVRRKFDLVSVAFLQWRSAETIRFHSVKCVANAMPHFGNLRKLRAIVEIARLVAVVGFDVFRRNVLADPIGTIENLPFMGPATARHLAKNIGVDVVKPDRHLTRMAAAARFPSPDELCERISAIVGDSISVIDTVLWRYATLDRDYLSAFAEGFQPTKES